MACLSGVSCTPIREVAAVRLGLELTVALLSAEANCLLRASLNIVAVVLGVAALREA